MITLGWGGDCGGARDTFTWASSQWRCSERCELMRSLLRSYRGVSTCHHPSFPGAVRLRIINKHNNGKNIGFWRSTVTVWLPYRSLVGESSCRHLSYSQLLRATAKHVSCAILHLYHCILLRLRHLLVSTSPVCRSCPASTP